MVKIGTRTRQAPHDRNMLPITKEYNQSVGSHAWQSRWSYTVPSDRKYNHGVCVGGMDTAIATAGRVVAVQVKANIGGAGFRVVYGLTHYATDVPKITDTKTCLFSMRAGDQLQGWTFSNDTINHQIMVSAVGVEFEA